MPKTQHIGTAGQLAVMSELAVRGYNVAIPQIDIGDDIFVVNDQAGGLWRIQVKTSNAKHQKTSRAYSFRTRETAITVAANPDLYFIFVMREPERWRFLVMTRAVLQSYTQNHNVGTLSPNGMYRNISITLHDDGRATCAGNDLRSFLEDWSHWPVV